MATNFSTIGGVVTRGEAFTKLIHHVDEARDQCLVIAHLHQTEDNPKDANLAQGWRALEELLHRARTNIVTLAQGSIQIRR